MELGFFYLHSSRSLGRNHHHQRPIGDPISSETPPAASSETTIYLIGDPNAVVFPTGLDANSSGLDTNHSGLGTNPSGLGTNPSGFGTNPGAWHQSLQALCQSLQALRQFLLAWRQFLKAWRQFPEVKPAPMGDLEKHRSK